MMSRNTYLITLSKVAACIGLLGLLILACATIIDVIMRTFFGNPIYGLSDIFEFVTPPVVASCFPLTFAGRQNISIKLVGNKLPQNYEQCLELFGNIVMLLILCGMVWQMSRYAYDTFARTQTSWLLTIEVWPSWTLATLLLAICVPIQLGVIHDIWQNWRIGETQSNGG